MKKFVVSTFIALSLVIPACEDDNDAGNPAAGGAGSGGIGGAGGSPASGGATTAGSNQAGGSAGEMSAGGGGGEATADAGAGGEPASEGGAAGSDSAPTVKRVFVSSEVYVGGEIGGIVGGDASCQELADAESLGGIWLAWLSVPNASPADRFVHATLPYVLTDGSEIAANWDDLTDGTIEAPIDVDQTGNAVPVDSLVWTGTDASGHLTAGQCVAWDTVGSGAGYGSTSSTDSDWSFVSGMPCNTSLHIYCFEN